MTQRTPTRTNRRQVAAALGVTGVLIVGLGFGAVTAFGGDSDKAAQKQAAAQAAPKVMAPKDGSLRVGDTAVPQMVGACDGSSCYHVPQAKPAVVKAGKKTTVLPLKAGQSTLFSVGAFNEKHHNAAVPITVRGTDLVLEQMAPGSYLVTVEGKPNGGMWQFRLTIPGAAK